MTALRKTRRCIPASIAAASVLLLLVASPIAPSASGQSAKADEIDKMEAALLGLQGEFLEALHEITPEILAKQKEIVDQLSIYRARVEEEARVGQRTTAEIFAAHLEYRQALESLKVMQARSRNKSASPKALLRIRIEVRAEALLLLQKHLRYSEQQYSAGEITISDVAHARVQTLKAEIALEALKKAAGQ